jgi:hypothetical protein
VQQVPAVAGDITDLAGLREIGERLTSPAEPAVTKLAAARRATDAFG